MKTINTCIETELVCSDNGKNTYCITKRLKGVEDDTGIIVMLFPTRNAENLNSDDSTINHTSNDNFKHSRTLYSEDHFSLYQG